MIFTQKQIDRILQNKQVQTRKLVKEGQTFAYNDDKLLVEEIFENGKHMETRRFIYAVVKNGKRILIVI